jgi:hypothetical protein
MTKINIPTFITHLKQDSLFTGVSIALLSTWILGLALFFVQRKDFKAHEEMCFRKQTDNHKELKNLSCFSDEKNEAGMDSLFSTRDENKSTLAIMDAFAEYMKNVTKSGPQTLRMLGTTLRAFTNSNGMYYLAHDRLQNMYKKNHPDYKNAPYILTENQKKYEPEVDGQTNLLTRLLEESKQMKIQMIVLNPFCLEAYFRAQAEDDTPDKPFENLDDYKNQESPCLYSDLIDTIRFARKIKNKYPDRFEFRLSFFMNSMFLVMFPGYCFKQQYIMDRKCAKGAISSIPLVRYRAKSGTYQRFETHFDFMWARAVELEDGNEKGEKNCTAKGFKEGYLFDEYKKIAGGKKF